MVTFIIEDVHDITADIGMHEAKIDITDKRGSTSRIEMNRRDAVLLLERLEEALELTRLCKL